MKYDIYFHDDFDGRASAAVMLSFLHSRGDKIEHFVPVNFDIQDQWLKEGFFKKHKFFRGKRNPAIVVDFLYHPKAAFWFDHHPTTFKRWDWEKKFRPNKFRNWDPEYPSCCSQVFSKLVKHFGFKPPRHLKELAKWLDIVDGARYKSARQVIEMKEPALQIAEFIDRESTKSSLAWLIELLAQKSVKKVSRLPKIRKTVGKMHAEMKKARNYCGKTMKIFGKVAVVDASKNISFREQLRFMPFYLRSDIAYAIRIKKIGKKPAISFGANPWRPRSNKIDIGKFLKEHFNGGGHKVVGGAEFRNRKALEKAVSEIIKRFTI